MEQTTIEHENENITVFCPCCDNWEQTSADEPRNKMQSFWLVKWLEDVEDVERAKIKCLECKETFILNYKYND